MAYTGAWARTQPSQVLNVLSQLKTKEHICVSTMQLAVYDIQD